MSLIFGSIPILISGFGQYLFGWYGPFEFLNGLIIWYQRENIFGINVMTGLFNNPNYTGCALATVSPILFATFFIGENFVSFLDFFVGFSFLFESFKGFSN